MVSNSTPSASTSDRRPGSPTTATGTRSTTVMTTLRGQPRVTSTEAICGSRGDPRLGGLDVDPQERGARPRCRPPSAPARPAACARRRPGRCRRRGAARPTGTRGARPAAAPRRRAAAGAGGGSGPRGPATAGAPAGVTGAGGRRSGVRRRLPVRSRVGACPVRLIGARPPGRPFRRAPGAARSASSTSGPTIDTSPAPMVITRSPGRARAARAGAAADQEGSNSTRPAGSGTASATIAPVTPGTGSSRAP